MSDACRTRAQRPEPWFEAMEGRLGVGQGAERKKITGYVLPLSVVNQETNGGDPWRMLNGCLFKGLLASRTEREESGLEFK